MGNTDLDTHLAHYYVLDTSVPGLAVFHTRLGLSLIDAIGTVEDPHARRIITDLIDRTTAGQDGYAARDVLAHRACQDRLTGTQARELTDSVEACALGHGTVPAPLLADLMTALATTEEVMGHMTTGESSMREMRGIHA